jgi:uncharacterized protein (DUF1697 family)
MKIMDLREAKACLDEYACRLNGVSGMIKPNVEKGELGKTIEKLNDSLIAQLNVLVKEALVLSIMIWKEMNARHEQMWDFLDEWADLLVALNQLKIATDEAERLRDEKARADKLHAETIYLREMRLRKGYKEVTLAEIEFEKKYGHLYRYRQEPVG